MLGPSTLNQGADALSSLSLGMPLCRLRVHKDEGKHAVDGEGYYATCRRCGRERDISPKIGPSA